MKSKMSGVEIREVVRRLQQEGMEFLRSSCLVVNGVEVYPKEIEVYYYKVGEFEDYTVHQNELQTNNRNRFYVHRRGEERESSRIEGSRGGCDFVVSDKAGVYYSYLLRSVVIDGELDIVHNALSRLTRKGALSDRNKRRRAFLYRDIVVKENPHFIRISVIIEGAELLAAGHTGRAYRSDSRRGKNTVRKLHILLLFGVIGVYIAGNVQRQPAAQRFDYLM